MASNSGPWGMTQTQLLDNASRLNAAYSSFGWMAAKTDGCLPCPGSCRNAPSNAYPSWPPPAGKGFVYPELTKKDESIVGASGYNPNIESPGVAPWNDQAPEGLTPTQAMQRTDYAMNDQPQLTDSTMVLDATNPDGNIELSELVAQSILQGEIPQYAQNPSIGSCNSGGSVYERTFGAGKANHACQNSSNSCALADPDPADDTMTLQSLIPCMGNTLTGIIYDMQHVKEIPPEENKFNYIFMRDDRWKYGIIFFLFILLLILLIVAAAMAANGNGNENGNNSSSCAARKKIISLDELTRLGNTGDVEIVIRKSK